MYNFLINVINFNLKIIPKKWQCYHLLKLSMLLIVNIYTELWHNKFYCLQLMVYYLSKYEYKAMGKLVNSKTSLRVNLY